MWRVNITWRIFLNYAHSSYTVTFISGVINSVFCAVKKINLSALYVATTVGACVHVLVVFYKNGHVQNFYISSYFRENCAKT